MGMSGLHPPEEMDGGHGPVVSIILDVVAEAGGVPVVDVVPADHIRAAACIQAKRATCTITPRAPVARSSTPPRAVTRQCENGSTQGVTADSRRRSASSGSRP